MKRSTINLFWDKVDVRSDDECWPWKAYTDKEGYGQFWNGITNVRAHHFMYSLHRTLPDGMQVMHTCNNPSCVNPKHLWHGTYQQNVDHKMACGRHGYGSRARFYDGEVWLMKRLAGEPSIGYMGGKRYKIPLSLIGKMFKADPSVVSRAINRDDYPYKEMPSV